MNAVMGDIKLTSYVGLLPEIYLCCISMFLLLWGAYRQQKANGCLIFLGMAVFGLTAWLVGVTSHGTQILMNGMFIADGFGAMAKCLILLAGAMVLMLASGWLRENEGRPYEFVILMLFASLGMMLMVSANDLLTLYMALEMSSLALYVLASFNRDHAKSSEAGLKYFVLGALASGMMLFGMSLVYGFAGTTGFTQLHELFALNHVVSKGVIVGLVLIIVGFCFKLSAVPFHMWAPDVYEGAPTPVTAFFATAPKIAALTLFTRVLLQPFTQLIDQWQQVIILISIVSMLVGAFAAIMQTSIKRLLAYSSIGHVGFMLMGLAAGNEAGVQAMMIYLAVYIFMSAGAFGCVLLMARNGQYVEEIRDLAGLSQRQPMLALAFSIFMFSMAGIPPMAGFFGKMYIVLAAVSAHLTWLAVVGVATSVVGGYYYLKVVKVMYFDEPAQPFDVPAPRMVTAGIAIAATVTLLFCMLPTPLVAQAKAAAEALL